MSFVNDGNHSRVFVNNQNTPVSTVTLPQTVRHREQNMMINSFGNFSKVMPVDGFVGGGAAKQSFADSTYLQSRKTVFIDVPRISKEDIHSHLEDVYQRVMRQLQRKANYDEIGHVSLAKEFGIVETLDVDKNKGQLDVNSVGQSHSNFSTMSAQNQAKGNILKRRQYLPSNTTMSPTNRQSDCVDDTLFLSQQPCPKTLRLVLEVVKKNITEKLEFAENGSLKNCLAFVFESRLLLDRLLKEIPSYSHFQGEGERLPTALQTQELFQEFRRHPIVFPNAQYVKDANTGRVTAFVSEDGSGAPTCGLQGDSESLQTNTINNPLIVNVLAERSNLGATDSKQKVDLPNGVSIPIPPRYGKSTRERQQCNRYGHAVAGVAPRVLSKNLAAGTGGDKAATSGVHNDIFKNNDDVSQPQTFLSAGTTLKSSVGETTNNANLFTEKTELGEKRKATQMISVATLTDINDNTVVSRVEYDKLLTHIDELMVEIEELKQETHILQEQLDEECDYASQKRKVIHYLRETLYKECCILRSQISLAQQKAIHYQSLLKEQQNAITQTMNYVNADTRSGSNQPACESSCLPSVSTRFAANNDMSTLAVSFSRAPSCSKRKTLNSSSTVSVPQGTCVTDEQDDMGVSSVGSGVFSLHQTNQQRISIDITAVHSLLDLVLLAVENDQVLPQNSSKGKNVNLTIIANAMKDDAHKREVELKKKFSERERQTKHYFAISRAETASKLAFKDSQISRLKSFSNIHFLSNLWKEKSRILREELKRLRNHVNNDLCELGRFVFVTMDSIAKRARVVDTTLGDNHLLYNTQLALRDVISSAKSLLLPMLTNEYEHGYHPWPLKLRNTADPFAKLIKTRYGEQQVVLMREEINALSSLYLVAHKYVINNQITLNMRRPAFGKPLRRLCALLVLNNSATTEMWTDVRSKYIEECQFEQKIAQLNMSILALMYQQRITTERSVGAMYEAGMDPRLVGLPAQHAINKVAERLHRAVAERTHLRKQRYENARYVYRLWKKECIDIYNGYPVPSPPQRLVAVEMESAMVKACFPGVSCRENTRCSDNKQVLVDSTRKSKGFWDNTLLLGESVEGVSLQKSSQFAEDEGTAISDDLSASVNDESSKN